MLLFALLTLVWGISCMNSKVLFGSVSVEKFNASNTIKAFYFNETFDRVYVEGTKDTLASIPQTLYKDVDGVKVKVF